MTTDPARTARAPRKRNAERSKVSILRAAIKEFAASGFSGARTERIATSAECNIRLLYHYFSNKEQLYLAVLESAYEGPRSHKRLLSFDMEAPLESLLDLMHFTFNYFADDPRFESLLRNENIMRGRFVRRLPAVPEQANHLLARIEALIRAGEARGLFQPELDAGQLYVTITALSRFHLSNSYGATAGRGRQWPRSGMRGGPDMKWRG